MRRRRGPLDSSPCRLSSGPRPMLLLRWWPRGARMSPRSSPRSRSGIPKAGTPTISNGTRSTTVPSSSASPCCARRSVWSRPPPAGRRGAASEERFDATDHLMTYLFTGLAGDGRLQRLERGTARSRPGALPAPDGGTGRLPPRRDGGGSAHQGRCRRAALVADQGRLHPGGARGRAGPGCSSTFPAWAVPGGAAAEPLEPPYCTRDNSGLHISYLFLDDEPPDVARRLEPAPEALVGEGGRALLAAPFHSLVAYDWGRYCP